MAAAFLFLDVKGTTVEGEPMHPAEGCEKAIECDAFQQNVQVPVDSMGGVSTGDRSFSPVVISKSVDKSSPLLLKALTENAPIKATFQFFRRNPNNDGSIEQFYKVELDDARVVSVAQGGGVEAPTEQVSFAYQTITWTILKGGITHSDTWKKKKG
jgi:type VI secretion system secreted protein Hcp